MRDEAAGKQHLLGLIGLSHFDTLVRNLEVTITPGSVMPDVTERGGTRSLTLRLVFPISRPFSNSRETGILRGVPGNPGNSREYFLIKKPLKECQRVYKSGSFTLH